MPEVMRMSEPVSELFRRNAEARGLVMEKTPAAVQLAITQLGAGAGAFDSLLQDLPSGSRAYDWMACAFAAYAEWCDRTVVADDPSSSEPAAEPPTS